MNIISRVEAKKQNLKYYFTNIPCKHGHYSKRYVKSLVCIDCDNLRKKKHYNECKEYYLNYYKKNKNHKIQYTKNYNKNNRLKINQKKNKKYKNDINHKLAIILRGRLFDYVHRLKKVGSAVKDLGCSIEEFKSYIESLFQPGMTWENHTIDGWHLDHIKPLASFDLTDRNQFLEACHYTNIQPLWAKDNIKKGKKIL